jgi:hypothetical protein
MILLSETERVCFAKSSLATRSLFFFHDLLNKECARARGRLGEEQSLLIHVQRNVQNGKRNNSATCRHHQQDVETSISNPILQDRHWYAHTYVAAAITSAPVVQVS